MFHHEVSKEKSTNVRVVIHDSNDRFIPHREGIELGDAWPGGRLITTTALGHHRILRDPEVIDSAVAFISESSATTIMKRRAS